MLLTEISHIATLNSIKRFEIDIAPFNSIEELRKVITQKNREVQRKRNKENNYMKEYYKKNKSTMKFSKNKQPKEYFRDYQRKKRLELKQKKEQTITSA